MHAHATAKKISTTQHHTIHSMHHHTIKTTLSSQIRTHAHFSIFSVSKNSPLSLYSLSFSLSLKEFVTKPLKNSITESQLFILHGSPSPSSLHDLHHHNHVTTITTTTNSSQTSPPLPSIFLNHA